MLVNKDNSHTQGIPFSNNINPNKFNPIPLPYDNILSANSKFPSIKGGKRKQNKIYTKYMKKSRKNKKVSFFIRPIIHKYTNKIKKYIHTKYKHKNKIHKRTKKYKGGYSQYMNNKPIYNTYSTGGILKSSNSALANPVPYSLNSNEAIDNLNHNKLNAFGKSDTGMGYANKGWF